MVLLEKIIEGLEMVDKYKEQKYKEIAIEWCRQNELEYK